MITHEEWSKCVKRRNVIKAHPRAYIRDRVPTGCTMSVTRTRRTLPGCSWPGRRIFPSGKSRARFVASRIPSPPSNAPAEEGGGRLFGFIASTARADRLYAATREDQVRRFEQGPRLARDNASFGGCIWTVPYNNLPPCLCLGKAGGTLGRC